MPYRDLEERRAYARTWYASHRERVIAQVALRKRTLYAGVCKVCGGPTVGSSKNKIPVYCKKPACASAQRKAKHG